MKDPTSRKTADGKNGQTEVWNNNAARWTRAVRESLIPSRLLATDAAIIEAVVRRKPTRFLDAGCGEGWLVRRIAEDANCTAIGIDGSAKLIAAARQANPTNRYAVMSYDEMARASDLGLFDVIAFNFALFDADIAKPLATARNLLAKDGAVVVQTPHPSSMPEEERGRDGWRTEDFSGFEDDGWTPMRWFYRTPASWTAAIEDASLAVLALEEPRADPDGPPLSLLFTCIATDTEPEPA